GGAVAEPAGGRKKQNIGDLADETEGAAARAEGALGARDMQAALMVLLQMARQRAAVMGLGGARGARRDRAGAFGAEGQIRAEVAHLATARPGLDPLRLRIALAACRCRSGCLSGSNWARTDRPAARLAVDALYKNLISGASASKLGMMTWRFRFEKCRGGECARAQFPVADQPGANALSKANKHLMESMSCKLKIGAGPQRLLEAPAQKLIDNAKPKSQDKQ
ncbi:unnamed protein product, partial [Prorocentrum cordatum]